MATLQLDLVTPEKTVISQQVDYVGAPGLEGEFGVLPNHIPFLSALSIGVLTYKSGSTTERCFVSGGFAEVTGEKVTILAESAECAEDIDFARAERARERAEKRLLEHTDDINVARAQLAMHRATTRLSLQGRGGGH